MQQSKQSETQYSVGSVALGVSGTVIPRAGLSPRRGLDLEDALWGASEVENRFARAAMAAFPGTYAENVSWPLERKGAGEPWAPMQSGRSAALSRWTLDDAQKARAGGGSPLGSADALRLGQLAARVAGVRDQDLAKPEAIEKIAQMARTGIFEKELGALGLNPGGLAHRLRQAREATGQAPQASTPNRGHAMR